jgi:stage V sporulation protein S
MDVEQLKVSTRSNPNSVAGAMAGAVRQAGAVEVQVVGAGALNQAVKAVAIARGYVAASGLDLVCVPAFAEIVIEGDRRTAIRLRVEDRAGRRLSSSDGAGEGNGGEGDGGEGRTAPPAHVRVDDGHTHETVVGTDLNQVEMHAAPPPLAAGRPATG